MSQKMNENHLNGLTDRKLAYSSKTSIYLETLS